MQNIIEANAGNMMCLFNKSKVLLPFYNQKSVVIIIPFEEYVEFIRMCISSDLQIMSIPKKTYAYAISKYEDGKPTLLKRYYYYDIGYASMLSLMNASVEGRDATYIIHRFNNESKERLIGSIYDILSTESKESLESSFNSLHQSVDAQYPIQISNLSEHNEMYLYYIWYIRVLTNSKDFDTFNLQLEKGE